METTPTKARESHDAAPDMRIALPVELYRELERLALRHEKSVAELIRHAVEIHYGDSAVAARLRLVDRLARLEAALGDEERLHEEIANEARALRSL